MHVIKRSGKEEPFLADKIQKRIEKQSEGLQVNTDKVFLDSCAQIADKMTTKELDELIARVCAGYTSSHPDYSKLAARLSITRHYKETTDDYLEFLIQNRNLFTEEFYAKALKFAPIFQDNDHLFDYFGWKALYNLYLLKDKNGNVIERPQWMYWRVALMLSNSQEEAYKIYDELSNHRWSAASPILINAGTHVGNMVSCELHEIAEDSTEGLIETFGRLVRSSSKASGLGLSAHRIRSKSSTLSTGGLAGGLLKYCKILNEGMRFWDQGGKRPGAVAVYLEPWHKDIYDLLNIKKNTGDHNLRARDLFTAMWIPDLFMERVMEDSYWTLLCPNEIKKAGYPALDSIYGDEFNQVYNEIEEKVKAQEFNGTVVLARDIFYKIIESQIETGVPYILFKDTVNKFSMQSNMGTITSSNLCAEIVQYHSPDEIATCILSAVVLPSFVKNNKFDFQQLGNTVKIIVKGLNKLIDTNTYSNPESAKGAEMQRAIAIGIQGLADLFAILDMDYDAKEALELNKTIAKVIYESALEASCNYPVVYPRYEGSPYSKGYTHDRLFSGANPDNMEYKVANSLLTAIMPTASSARITGVNEAGEPFASNLSVRKVKDGEYTIINKHLVRDLEKLGIWSEELKNQIIQNNGSIQMLDLGENAASIKNKYRTAFELSQKSVIDMAISRAPYIDQTQSMNLFFEKPTVSALASAYKYAWQNNLKTGIYYLRSKPVSTGGKFLAIDNVVCETGCTV